MKDKEKKHRHKWTEDWCDCPYCQVPHAYCAVEGCGELKNLTTGKINDF